MRFHILLVLFALLWAPFARSTEKPCDDSGKVYKICSNQEEIFKSSVAKAKGENKNLVLVLGAEWCPWCLSLHKILHDPAFGGEFAKRFVLADIGMYEGKKKLESGLAVFAKLQEAAHSKKKLDGVPLLALMNPQNGKAVLIDTEPLEKNTKTSKGHDPKKVLAALEKAEAKLR